MYHPGVFGVKSALRSTAQGPRNVHAAHGRRAPFLQADFDLSGADVPDLQS
jgi:hypothetical protein